MKIFRDRSSPSKKRKKKNIIEYAKLNHPTNPFEDDWDVRISRWGGGKRASL